MAEGARELSGVPVIRTLIPFLHLREASDMKGLLKRLLEIFQERGGLDEGGVSRG